MQQKPKTLVYVDGFNLYYRKLEDTPYKWLNVRRLSELLLPNFDVQDVHYFTAKIVPRPGDDIHKPQRQQTYIRALESVGIKITYGTFQTMPKRRPLLNEIVLAGGAKIAAGSLVWIVNTEEKGSDVNLATLLLGNAAAQRCEVSVVVSNDSDLELPIRVCCQELGHKVGVLSTQSSNSLAIKSGATFYKQIRQGALAASQFAAVLHDASGEIRKPATW